MDWNRLIEELAAPRAFPDALPTAGVEVRHTHLSVVYLTDRFVYKLRKPVNLGFVDFTTPESREKDCHDEVRLNRPMAPGVYLGVVPVLGGPGGPRFGEVGEAGGAVLEWAVKMARLDDGATLLRRMERGELEEETFARLGARIAGFHAKARADGETARYGALETVSQITTENFIQAADHPTLPVPLREKLLRANAHHLERLGPLIAHRARAGMSRDVHGDLHLDHIYAYPDRSPPGDLLVLDCVEFNDAYRCGDVVGDMAFLVMDLLFHRRPAWARIFADAYFAASADEEGHALLAFYVAYRAAVRAKVEGMAAGEEEVPADERAAAGRRARAHWLLALGELAPPVERPALLLTAGAPGSGKSRLAADLTERLGLTRITSDVVRKELAGLAPTESGRAGFGEGIYTPAWNERTYEACYARAREALYRGERVLVDASFREEGYRARFTALAAELCVPPVIFHRVAPDEEMTRRLTRRKAGAVSDADLAIGKEALARWEPMPPETAGVTVTIPHMADKHAPLARALEHLRALGLA